MMQAIIFLAVSILILLVLYFFFRDKFNVIANNRANKTYRCVFADNHIHYLDFVQKTDGFENLIKAMDKVGVKKAVIFGMPMVKIWSETDPIHPTYYLESDARVYYYSATDYIMAMELLHQPKSVQKRFFPFICGINPLDQNAVDQIELLLKIFPNFWKGIGEIISRHDDLTALTYGESPRADHPALMRVYQLATHYQLPVLIHHDISSAYHTDPIYLKEIEHAISANPKTTFIWAHAGISRRINVPTIIDNMRYMLQTYPNLYLDISWIVLADYIMKNEQSKMQWIKLFEEFSEHVLIGSDQVGHWDTYSEEILKYQPLLEALTPETAKKLGGDNILRILNAN